MSIVRAEVIARMRVAFRGGLSASRFITDMRSSGLSYRRTDMLSDWRAINQLETKDGLARFVRKDRFPTDNAMAVVDWSLSKEFMYKIKVFSVTQAGAPITERFVNIMSANPLTPTQMEAEVTKQWQEWERYSAETITGLQVWSAVHKVME
ncbi:hypothetical protein LCGC14_0984180 [marine sediment metagenome]|uniref:Uncharacterized protein n=1 Tax=marine sediment metagenome TaxID=412755 RepID=A0A0F9QR29_9ZZZZ